MEAAVVGDVATAMEAADLWWRRGRDAGGEEERRGHTVDGRKKEKSEGRRRWMARIAERERRRGGGGSRRWRSATKARWSGVNTEEGTREVVGGKEKEAAAGVGGWQGGTVGGDEKRKKGEQRQRWWHRIEEAMGRGGSQREGAGWRQDGVTTLDPGDHNSIGGEEEKIAGEGWLWRRRAVIVDAGEEEDQGRKKVKEGYDEGEGGEEERDQGRSRWLRQGGRRRKRRGSKRWIRAPIAERGKNQGREAVGSGEGRSRERRGEEGCALRAARGWVPCAVARARGCAKPHFLFFFLNQDVTIAQGPKSIYI